MKKNESGEVCTAHVDGQIDTDVTSTGFRGPLRGARPVTGDETGNVDIVDFSWLPEMRLLQRPFAA